MQDRDTKLLNFEMEVMNILHTKAYELSAEEEVPVIKNWLGWEGHQLIMFHPRWKMLDYEGPFHSVV